MHNVQLHARLMGQDHLRAKLTMHCVNSYFNEILTKSSAEEMDERRQTFYENRDIGKSISNITSILSNFLAHKIEYLPYHIDQPNNGNKIAAVQWFNKLYRQHVQFRHTPKVIVSPSIDNVRFCLLRHLTTKTTADPISEV